jgi:hypothetical protein
MAIGAEAPLEVFRQRLIDDPGGGWSKVRARFSSGCRNSRATSMIGSSAAFIVGVPPSAIRPYVLFLRHPG